ICLNFVDAETNCTGNSCRRRKLRKQFCASLSYGRFHTAWALFGHGAMSDLSPLSGVKRKLDFGAVRAAFDPTRTLAPKAVVPCWTILSRSTEGANRTTSIQNDSGPSPGTCSAHCDRLV